MEARAAPRFVSAAATQPPLGTLPALASKEDVVILDKLCHASLIDGARLSGATLRVFPHNHLGKLESHLDWARREYPEARVIVVTESIFSMDGDRAPLRELVELKRRFGATLLLDEAHAIGVVGPHGRGLAAELGLEEEIEVQLGTLSKSFRRERRLHLRVAQLDRLADQSRARLSSFPRRRRRLWPPPPPPRFDFWFRTRAKRAANCSGGESSSCGKYCRRAVPPLEVRRAAIIPWLVGEEHRALDLAEALQQEGFFVPAIRYPTVAKGAARLRITISAAHSALQIASLGEAIGRLAGQGSR